VTRLAFFEPFDGDDDLLDSVGLEDLEVQQPGVLDRCLRLAVAEHAVDGVAQQNLEVVDEAEGRDGEIGVPLVQRHGPFMVAVGGVEEPRVTGSDSQARACRSSTVALP
jgi:hypothetical protein